MQTKFGRWNVKIPILAAILLTESAILLVVALIIYNQPSYEQQALGYAIPGAIIGAIGIAFLFRYVRDGA